MQENYVMAFRKRLIKRHYTNVSIKKIKGKEHEYIVTAVEPLAKNQVEIQMGMSRMINDFR